jgi:4-alpha-glucanotransferase
LANARLALAEDIQQIRFAQFLLFRQGVRLREYAESKGISLIGDVPFYVSPDSSDIWANPELFLLDEQHRPRFVAGVPPDYFSPQGQLWGNPVFNWEALRETGYRWYIDRVRTLLHHVDAVRLDHFRGFAAAWYVDAGSPTAQSGQWVPGPGADFFRALERELGSLPLIAEDLGYITQDVHALRDAFRLPGMRVLQFAFDGKSDNPHRPSNYTANTLVYTGTHDNPPSRGWYEALSPEERKSVCQQLELSSDESEEITWELIRLASSSAAALAIVPLQDVLNLDLAARMNIPGRADGNWSWRATEEMLAAPVFDRLAKLTASSNRGQAARSATKPIPIPAGS